MGKHRTRHRCAGLLALDENGDVVELLSANQLAPGCRRSGHAKSEQRRRQRTKRTARKDR